MNDIQNKEIINQIELVVKEAQLYVVSTVNIVLLKSYLKIGEIISNSKKVSLRELERELKPKYGDGFSRRNFSRMIIFFKDYGRGATLSPHLCWSHYCILFSISKIYSVATLWQHLNWSHYKLLITIKDENERHFYEKTCNDSLWSVRELQRQIKSSLYERVLLGELDTTSKNELITKDIQENVFLSA